MKTNNKLLGAIALFILCITCPISTRAQSFEVPSLAAVAIPPAPDAAALGRYAEIPVGLYNGTAQVGVPIWTLSGRDLSLPISLSNHASGIRVDDIASRVGLGWSLNAGGVITRTVHGLPDETAQGWLSVAAQIPLPAQGTAHQSSAYIPQQQTILMEIAKGRLDAQPDQFFVNMPGYSGKIIFDRNGNPQAIPYEKLKIETDWANRTWIITTTDGVCYHFGGAATERTVTTSDCGQSQSNGFISSWYLTEINSPNGDRITLDYQSGGLMSYPLPLTETAYLGTSGNAACANKATDICRGDYFTGIVRIEKIESARASVTFEYDSQPRQDIANDRRLASITVRDKSNDPVRTFSLSHSYFSGRLMLDAVTETGTNNTQNAPTTFGYYKDKALPPRGSFNQDHWGFANGANNQTLIPRTELTDCRVLGSADRRPNFFYSRAGSIQGITYPAGGSSHFEYESHRFDPGPAGQSATELFVSAKAFCSGGPCGSPSCTNCQPTETQSFTIDQKQCVTIELLLDNPGRAQGVCDGEVRLKKVNGPVLNIWNCSAQSATQTYTLDLAAGDYEIESRAFLPDDFASARVNFTKSIPNRQFLAGGIRILRITDHDDFDTANDILREFTYETTPGVSSGALVKTPSYLFDYTEERSINSQGGNSFFNCLFKAACGSSIVPLGSTQGGHVGYAQVTTHYGSGGSNGTTTSHFVNPQMVPDGVFEYPYGPVTSNDHRRGLLLRTVTQDKNGKIVAEAINEYEDGTMSAIQSRTAGLLVAFSRRSTNFPNDPIANPMMVRKYNHHSQWGYLKKTTQRTYDENGTDYMEKVTEFEYGNPVHTQLTAERMTDSHGRDVIRRYRYPADFAAGTGDAHATAITKLASDQFRHDVVIEQVMAQQKPNASEEVIGAVLTSYKEFSLGRILPEERFVLETDVALSNFQYAAINGTFNKDSRYVLREVAERYDDKGNLLQALQKNGIRASFKWSHAQSLPIAQVLNGTSASAADPLAASTAFLSFEDYSEQPNNPDEDFWQFNPDNAHRPNAHTGKWCRRIRPGAVQTGPMRELRPLDQTNIFVFSAWVKTPGNYGGGRLVLHTKADGPNDTPFPSAQLYNSQVIVPIPTTGGEWTYIEARLDLGALRHSANVPLYQQLRIRAFVENNDPNNALRIDDLRIQPDDARMTTMTFDPLIGRTSTSDPNDIATYYEYDGLGRLRQTRDQERNILSRHQYDAKLLGQSSRNRITTDFMQVRRRQETAIDQLSIGKRYRTVMYGDGFGREVQTLGVQASPDGADLVKFTDYDAFGRERKDWLPYARPLNGGNFVLNPEPEQESFYQATAKVATSFFPFAELRFDDSPLNRIVEQGAEGNSWQLGNGHTVRTRYIVNTNSHPILKWELQGASTRATGLFPTRELVGIHTIDEDEGEMYEFRDKLGRIAYRKVKRLDGHAKQGGIVTSWLETYWVYDDFGNLAYVIPPKAMDLLKNGPAYDLSLLTEDLVFNYQYDKRHRQIVKKIPGKSAEEYVYDNLDRVLLHRDGNLRAKHQWQFNKYDFLGRPATSGIFNNTTVVTRQAMQMLVDNVLSNQLFQNYEKRTAQNFGVQRGYTDQSFPNAAVANGMYEILRVNYYDHYDFDLDGTPDLSYTPDPEGQFADETFHRLRDRTVATHKAMLNKPGLSAAVNWIEDGSFIDIDGREIQRQTSTQFGDLDLMFFAYDFGGKMTQSKRFHRYGTPKQVRVAKRYVYDHAGRVKKAFEQHNNDPEILLTQSSYNEIGELVERDVHKAPGQRFLQSVDYRYHIRGWLTNINNCNLSNDLKNVQKLWYLAALDAMVIEKSDRLGRSGLYLEVQLSKCDQQGPRNAPGMKTLIESATIPIMPEDSTSLTYQQLKAIENQAVPLTLAFPDLNSPAAVDSAEDLTAQKYGLALAGLGLTDSAATSKFISGVCSIVLKQAEPVVSNDDNNDLFGMELSYEKGNVQLQGDPIHTGNISALCWTSRSDEIKRGYGFRYDQLGRLTAAHYAAIQPGGKKFDSEIGHYSVPDIEYDQNGNILQLTRHGWRSNATFGVIDYLRYSYDGNRLKAVQEQSPATGFHDFRDNGATTQQDYLYDDNGNLIADANKAVSVSYNHLNLPEVVDFAGGNRIEYLYDASGTKHSQLVVNAAAANLRKDYTSGFVYAAGNLEFFASEEGRVVPDSSCGQTFRHELYYSDHLGNTRLGYSDLNRDGKVDASEILQEKHYYPFGMTFGGLGTVQQGVEHKFQFNGKELSDAHGLYWHEFGARFYDAQLGRWHAVDPLAESSVSLSPMAFGFNNPVKFVDPDGMLPTSTDGGDKRKHPQKHRQKAVEGLMFLTEEGQQEAGLNQRKGDDDGDREFDEAIFAEDKDKDNSGTTEGTATPLVNGVSRGKSAHTTSTSTSKPSSTTGTTTSGTAPPSISPKALEVYFESWTTKIDHGKTKDFNKKIDDIVGEFRQVEKDRPADEPIIFVMGFYGGSQKNRRGTLEREDGTQLINQTKNSLARERARRIRRDLVKKGVPASNVIAVSGGWLALKTNYTVATKGWFIKNYPSQAKAMGLAP